MSIRRFAIVFLAAEVLGATLWWALLLTWPASRAPFRMADAPDATLLAFAAADGFLFIGTAAACAYGFWSRRKWAWPLLCIHTGAAAYAGLYCWGLTMLTGDAWLGAAMMTPSLIVPGILVVRLRPGGLAC